MRTLWLAALITSFGLAQVEAGVSSWIPVGPPGGNVRALAADPRDPQRIYLGTPDGVLYRSDDHGRHWRRVRPGFPRRGSSLDEIVVDPRGVVHVGFWEVSGGGGGVARSTDGGETFTLAKALEGESVRALALAPSRPEWIAAGTLNGVFLSRDSGKSWARISPSGHRHLRNVESLAFDPADPQVLYAGTWHLAWKTLDGGATWRPVHQGMIDDSHVMTLNIDRRHRQSVYATACTGIYRSTDGGSRWTKLGGIPDSSRRTRSFHQGPDDGNLLLAGTTAGLWVSEDRGVTWRRATSEDMVINALILQPDGTILIGTEEEGVLRSSDLGLSWITSNSGFTERFISRLLFDQESGRVFVGVLDARPHGGVFAAADVRGPWTRLGKGLDGRQVLSLALLGGSLYAGTDDGIFVRAPQASVWTRLPTRLDGRGLHARVTDLLALPRRRLLAATSTGILSSFDGGRSWTRAALGGSGAVHALAASPADPDVLVAATALGFFRSVDGGRTWTQVSPRLKNITPHALAFVPSADPVLLATTSGGLLRSRDLGATWRPVTGGIPRSDLTGLAVHPDGRTIFASDFTRGGIFRSADGGSTWERMATDGLASDRVWTLSFDPGDPRRLLAAAPAGGLHLLAPVSSAADSTAVD